MTRVLVYTTSGDDALVIAQVVAGWTARRLEAEAHEVTVLADAGRAGMEAGLAAAAGVAAFSHGRPDALLDGSKAPVLDHQNIGLLAGRWAWLYACRTAHELAALATDAGAACFAGFDVAVHVDWEPGALPNALRPSFERLLTEVPSLLAGGETEVSRFQEAIRPLVDAVLDYCVDHDDAPPGIEITAQQMLRRLVIRVGGRGAEP